ncbi:catalase [Skermanella stibiiresistens SB22]|uniref:Catalase-related peroxidase n=1 Tax=Skermanella stibiiresistens SB22 TaxID=1385369 RepID=W9HA58_9PROT|nr:catalase family peroxidase [Skermanella stibiiresistens]EWY41597.1 catalase [Skermanella stibiiresistens SB22]
MRRSLTSVSLIALGFLTTTLAVSPAALAQEPQVEEQIVDAFQQLFGKHAGERTNHAKGIVAEGEFQAAQQAADLTTAAHFQTGTTVPVKVRFSNATGIPTLPDGDPNANPHGLAVKFSLPDGAETDIVINSLKFFPVATGAEFRDLLLAVAASGPNSPKPTKLEQFVAAHPAVAKAGATVATPESFATENYFGINAFAFTNKAGETRFIRYVAEPLAGVSHLAPADAAKRAPDFLSEDLAARLAREPVRFRLLAQVAEPGDAITDATIPWPEDRRRVELGTLTITKLAADNKAAAKELLFLPGNVTDGIAPSDDPLIAIRDAAYAVSFSRRSE